MFRLQTYDAVSSTNEVVKGALRVGEPEGLAVQALEQTGGYGRQGRSWASPRGGLYLSVLLRPQVPMEQLSTLSLVAGLAVRRAALSLIPSEYAEKVLIKWPNDVVIVPLACQPAERLDAAASPSTASSRVPADSRTEVRVACANPRISGTGETLADPSTTCDLNAPQTLDELSRSRFAGSALRERGLSEREARVPQLQGAGGESGAELCEENDCGASTFAKLCGISLEAVGGGVCLGIGVNVLPPEEPLTVGGKNVPAYLAELGCASIDAARDTVLRELAGAYKAWLAEGFAPFVGEFCAADALCGREVTVADQRGGVLAAGKACGVDEEGRLIVDVDGDVEPVSSGEAHLA